MTSPTHTVGAKSVTVCGRRIAAAVFDMDGVVTDTASVHAAAWADVFDELLERVARRRGEPFEPFTERDYLRHVDGVSRYDGVRNFLASRGIELDEGDPEDPPDRDTVCGVGNRKNDRFLERLERDGARRYDETVAFVERLIAADVPVAVISASRNAGTVLAAAGVDGLFPVRVDGDEAARLDLPGKPDPAVFLEAAARLGADPAEAMVVEDSLAGVDAGRRGGFALVVGVDRGEQVDELADRGAHVVVDDLTELLPADGTAERSIAERPHVDERWDEVRAAVEGADPVVFLDFDGTLSPIVDDPSAAGLPEATRETVTRLAAYCPVVVVSGRDTDDVRRRVAVDGLVYAGSHGFDVVWADGSREQRGTGFLADLDDAEAELRDAVDHIPGVEIERKGFAIAIHYRRTPVDDVDRVIDVVQRAVADAPRLRRTGGKKVFELRPDLDWDKGTTLLWMLERLGHDGSDIVPIYVGDDLTDEDAFAVLGERGIGVVVQGEDDDRATSADYRVRDVDEARAFLERLIGLLEEPS